MNQRTETTRAPLIFRATINASPEQVFQTFFGAAERWLCRESFIETWEHGQYRFCWPGMCVAGRFVQFLPPHVARFSWHVEGDPLPDTMVVVGLDRLDGGGTRLEVEHYGFGAGDDWDTLYMGAACAWAGYLKNLRAVIEAGLDLREDDE